MVLSLHAINVKCGDATLLQMGDATGAFNILIDAGEERNTVHEYLKAKKINRLDLVVASHIDMDHIGGLKNVIDDYSIEIGELWITDINIFRDFLRYGVIRRTRKPSHVMYSILAAAQILNQLDGRNINCRAVYEGYATSFGDLKVEVLYPPATITDYITSAARLRGFIRKYSSRVPPAWWLPPDTPEIPATPQSIVEQRLKSDRIVLDLDTEDLARYLEEGWPPPPRTQDQEVEQGPNGQEDEIDYFESQHLMNDTSVVLKIIYGNKSLLFCGDLTNWTYVLTRHANSIRDMTIFKVPHHGSYVYEFGARVDLVALEKYYREVWELFWPYSPNEFFDWFERFYGHKIGSEIPKQSHLLYAIVNPEVVLVFPRNRKPHLPYLETRKTLSGIKAGVLCTMAPLASTIPAKSCLQMFTCNGPSARQLLIYKHKALQKSREQFCQINL